MDKNNNEKLMLVSMLIKLLTSSFLLLSLSTPLPPTPLPHPSNWMKNSASKTVSQFFFSENTRKFLAKPPSLPSPLIVSP